MYPNLAARENVPGGVLSGSTASPPSPVLSGFVLIVWGVPISELSGVPIPASVLDRVFLEGDAGGEVFLACWYLGVFSGGFLFLCWGELGGPTPSPLPFLV